MHIYIQSLNLDELCYYIDQSNTWMTGEKATINIQLDKDYDDWNVTFAYDTDIVNLEAWKGDVTSINQSTYNVQSKCYNSKLYACQVCKRSPLILIFIENSRFCPLVMFWDIFLMKTLHQQFIWTMSLFLLVLTDVHTWECLQKHSCVSFGMNFRMSQQRQLQEEVRQKVILLTHLWFIYSCNHPSSYLHHSLWVWGQCRKCNWAVWVVVPDWSLQRWFLPQLQWMPICSDGSSPLLSLGGNSTR